MTKSLRIADLQDKRMFFYLLLLSFGCAMSFQGWQVLYTNFAVQGAGLTGAESGFVQSIREVPGLLTLGLIPLLLIAREHRLAAVFICVLGLGVMSTGFFPFWLGLIGTTFITSMGDHYFEATSQSLQLQYFDRKQAPLVMGKIRGFTAAGSLLMSASLFFLANYFTFTSLYLVVGSAALCAGLIALTMDPSDPNKPKQRRKMILKKKYWLFYVLTFLSGARRQIFTVFSLFLLVDHFNFALRDVALLFMFNHAVNWFLNPLIGRAINAVGERTILTVEYASLIVIFIAYALTDSPLVAGILYVLDHVLYNFVIAVRTFFQKIAEPEDIAPSMAVGMSVNHVAAVLIPTIGGLLWMIDYRIPFFAGAVLAFCSLLLAQRIDKEVALADMRALAEQNT